MGDDKDERLEAFLGRGSEQKPPKPQEAARAPAYELPEVLQRGSPAEILLRLVDEDPFELRSRCVQRAREHAVLLNPMRLVLNTMGRIALAAKSYAGAEPVAEWIEIAIEVSIEDMLDEQNDEERRGLPVAHSPDAEFYEDFAGIAGIDAVDARSACVALNGMSDDHREAFHAVVVRGRPVDDWAAEAGRSPDEVRELLREVGVAVQARVEKRRKARRRRRL